MLCALSFDVSLIFCPYVDERVQVYMPIVTISKGAVCSSHLVLVCVVSSFWATYKKSYVSCAGIKYHLKLS